MEKIKRKNTDFNESRYWRFFLPLAIILYLCLRFPIRITLPDLYDDILLYGSISLTSFLTGLWIYRRSKWAYRRLLAVIFFCGVLAGWQVIDLGVLRLPPDDNWIQFGQTAGNGYDAKPDYWGITTYSPRVNNPDPRCFGFREIFLGNPLIAIRIDYGESIYYCEG